MEDDRDAILGLLRQEVGYEEVRMGGGEFIYQGGGGIGRGTRDI